MWVHIHFFFILRLFLSKAKRYLYCRRRSNYQEGELEGWDLMNRLSRHTFVPVPSQDCNSNVIFRGLVYFQRVEVRGECAFCWYLCNCGPLLFKLSFHKIVIDTSPNCLIGYLAEKRSKKGPNRDKGKFCLPIGKQTRF